VNGAPSLAWAAVVLGLHVAGFLILIAVIAPRYYAPGASHSKMQDSFRSGHNADIGWRFRTLAASAYPIGSLIHGHVVLAMRRQCARFARRSD
jgi:hypothetical protein